MSDMKKTDEIIERVLTGLEGPSAKRFEELENEVRKLRSSFWKHKHRKHGWDKDRVVVERDDWDP